jgi:hypothetical protein
MNQSEQSDSPDAELTAALGSLLPAGTTIDPVAAAFTAGRNSARRQTRLWKGISVVVVALGIGAWMIPDHRDEAIPPMVARSDHPPAPDLTADSVVMLQQAVLDHGLDGLPQSSTPPFQRVEISDFQ